MDEDRDRRFASTGLGRHEHRCLYLSRCLFHEINCFTLSILCSLHIIRAVYLVIDLDNEGMENMFWG